MGTIKRIRAKYASDDPRAIPRKGKKRKRVKEYTAKRRPILQKGQQPYERVEALVPIIKEMVAAGLTRDKIARLCINPDTGEAISEPTLRKYYADALELGADEVPDFLRLVDGVEAEYRDSSGVRAP